MTIRALILAALLAGPAQAEIPPAEAVEIAAASPGPLENSPAPRPRPAAAAAQCSPDGSVCIDPARYLPDVCRAIETAAGAHGVDAGFFARLIWRESLFDAGAVSPAGAQGIAQFMPETAKLEGLGDSFNPAEALTASARYLADLSGDYGNMGLAAVAYNGGRARVERFIAAEGGLAAETRAYVQAITGFSAEDWRDAPPPTVDLALTGDGDFQARCLALAATRGRAPTEAGPPPPPWGVIIASNRDREGAQRQAARLKNRMEAVIGGETVHYTRTRLPGMARRMYYAQLGRDTRREAEALCRRLQAAGGDCMVRSN